MQDLGGVRIGGSLSRLRRLVSACDRFEAACRSGLSPRVEDYLADSSPAERPDLRDRLAALARAHGLADATLADPDREVGTPDRGPETIDELLPETREPAEGSEGEEVPTRAWLSTPSAGPTILGEIPIDRLPVGTLIGEYKVLERVGRGGMGVVYRVENLGLHGRIEALKLIHKGDGLEPTEGPACEAIGRFHEEIRSQALIEHRNIVEIFGVGSWRGRPFFTMRFIEGGSLGARLRDGPLPDGRAASLMEKVARAVAYLHASGVVHRDLKPGNILLDAAGEPSIGDFGLAKALGTEHELTTTGALLGSPPYMAPEQATDATGANESSDVYSLGATLYACLTGRPPFQASVAVETIRQVLHDDPVPPRRLNPSVSGDLEAICLKCLEKDPTRRFASADELADELGRAARGEPVRTRPPAWPELLWRWRRRHPGVAALLIALAATIALGFGGVLWGWRQAEAGRLRLLADKYYDRIALAHAAIQANRADRAGPLLDDCPESLRGWEWRLLRGLRLAEPARLVNGTSTVYGLAFRPGGSALVAGGRHGAVRVFDARDGRAIATLGGVPAEVEVRGVAWSGGDGPSRIAAACHDGVVRAWEFGQRLTTPRPIPMPAGGHAMACNSVAFVGGDGRLLVSVGEDGLVLLWDLDARTVARFGQPGRPIRSVVASPDARGFATTGDDRKVRVWDLASRKGDTLGSLADVGHGLAYRPDGRRLASAGADGSVLIWDLERPGDRLALEGHLDGANAVAFSPDGLRLASSGADGSVKIWDIAAGRESLSLRTKANQVEGLAFSPDGSTLAGGCTDGGVILWDAGDRPEPAPARGQPVTLHEGPVVSLAFAPDGGVIASAGDDGAVRLTRADWSGPSALLGHEGKVNALAFHPGGRLLASAGRDRLIRIWDVREGGPAFPTLAGHAMRTTALAFAGDGRLASSGGDRKVRLWDLADPGHPRIVGEAGDDIYALAIDPLGRRIAAAGADGSVLIWDVEGGGSPSVVPAHRDPVSALAFNRDGSMLASASHDHTAALWDLSGGGRPVRRLEGHASRVWGVAFCPVGPMLATSGGDGTVRVWDVDDGRLVATLRGHSSRVYAVAFRPDGKVLASAGADGLVKTWDASAWEAPPRPNPLIGK